MGAEASQGEGHRDLQSVLRPGRWVQRRRQVQLEKQGDKRERFFIGASHFPHTPQGQLLSHCLLGSLGSFAERSAWCWSLPVYLAAPCTFPQWLRQLQRLLGLSCYRRMWCHQTEKLQMRYWAARCIGQHRKHGLALESGRHDTVDVGQG